MRTSSFLVTARAIGFAIAVLSFAPQPILADAASDGKKTYMKCKTCHSLDAGQHRVGPSLLGVFGAQAGLAKGFSFSPAMENSRIVWDEENLDAFLADPRGMLPGTRMFFPGLGREQDRKAIIAYLKQQSGANGQSREKVVAAPPGARSGPDNPDRYTGSGNFALRAAIAEEQMVFVGVGGGIDGGPNPDLGVREGNAVHVATVRDIVRDPSDLPPALTADTPRVHNVTIETIEVDGQLANGTTFRYWTFGGKVPGPFLRVRVGDTVNLTLTNNPDSVVIHSIDLHAVTGPGGGAGYLQVSPGGTKTVTFKAIVPGLFVYHCGAPMVAHHIARGMYGMILVEPDQNLPAVDREFYVRQGEIYTGAKFGARGEQFFSVEKLLDEAPEYFVFNGAAGALAADHPLRARVGETVRIYFGVAGPNFTSAFHVIGEMFDRAWVRGGVVSPPELGLQTISVPPGGALIVDFKIEIPGRYILVDHALSRMERGLIGFLYAEGEENPEIYQTGTGQ
jgi:nitrite reductase (NO-forming)